MSLLLDALKKAALEKQRREESLTKQPGQDDSASNNSEKSTAIDTPKKNVETKAKNDAENQEASTDQTNKKAVVDISSEAPLLEEAPVDETPLEFDLEAIDDNYRLVMEIEQDAEKKAEQARKLEEPIEELAIAQTMTDEEGFVIDEALIEKSLQEAAAQIHAAQIDASKPRLPSAKTTAITQQETTEIPTPAAEETAPPATVVEAAPVIPPSTQAATENHITHFNAHSGKDALNKLLSRSNQAAKNARKRMIVIYAMLTLTSVTLVGLYYYLLSSGGPISHPVATNSVATEAVVTDAGEQEDPQVYADDEAALLTEESTIADESDDATSASIIADSDTDNASTPAPSTVVASIADVAEENKTQTAQAVEIKNSRTAAREARVAQSVSLPAEQPPRQAIITRQAAVDDISESISRGYQAYQKGDFETAESAYREALAEDPHQRDALLGAAAVAVQLNRHDEALRFYQQRLARAPKDEYAQAGILALTTSSENNPQFDTELNRLLREYPKAAHLHFLKGSLYASRQQWGAAQLSFFEAWQRNNKNPDYAFNLAVAMDHIQEPKEAIRFYQQALSLSGDRQVGFSIDAVQRRVQELEQQ